MEILGKIKLIGEVKTFGDNGFRKRELVVTTEEQYPQHILIEFVQNVLTSPISLILPNISIIYIILFYS